MRLLILTGYRRENGAVGFRNHIVVISSVVCANVA
ncbi:MAG: UxaA family hydrolase, partial [Dethiobacteria bacterium]